MKIPKLFFPLFVLLSFSVSTSYASEYSKIDEKILLNPSNSGSTVDKVMIYSNVRSETIELAMNTQFNRIENMMFVNTVYEPDSDEEEYEQDEDCD